MVRFKNFLSKNLENDVPSSLLPLLPRGYKRVGHIGIINLKSSLLPYATVICEKALTLASNVRSFAIASHVEGQFRNPSIQILAGDNSQITVHKENNCLFKLDATQIMFSSGNHFERKRMMQLTKPGEKILDMFCCVGNLSMPIARSRPDVRITGIELNPVAYKYLLETMKLNKVENRFEAIFGDNRKVDIPKGFFDRIIMGYFTVDDIQLKRALEALKPEGGVIHIHDVPQWGEKEMKERIITILSEMERKKLFFINKFLTKRIKWIAENTPHVVHDVEISN
ncbi:MAG: class I SAM-dependent methyltransferase family protein [Candidatus Odinarchaeota archaeon]